MDWQAWKTALGLFMSNPELIVAALITIGAVFGFAWWLCTQFNKGQVAALRERLELASGQQSTVQTTMHELTGQVSQLSQSLQGRTIPITDLSDLIMQAQRVNGTVGDLSRATSGLTGTLQLSRGVPVLPPGQGPTGPRGR
jgi:hypothetical protein